MHKNARARARLQMHSRRNLRQYKMRTGVRVNIHPQWQCMYRPLRTPLFSALDFNRSTAPLVSRLAQLIFQLKTIRSVNRANKASLTECLINSDECNYPRKVFVIIIMATTSPRSPIAGPVFLSLPYRFNYCNRHCTKKVIKAY